MNPHDISAVLDEMREVEGVLRREVPDAVWTVLGASIGDAVEEVLRDANLGKQTLEGEAKRYAASLKRLAREMGWKGDD